MANPTIIFLHIPKTGGSTLRTVLERQFRPGEIYIQPRALEGRPRPEHLHAIEEGTAPPTWEQARVTDDVRTGEIASLPQERLESLRLIEGHFLFGVHEALPGPSTYVTLLRDPVDRVLSLYDYRVRRQGVRIDLERYLSTAADLELSNGQTWLLSRPEEPVRLGASTEEMVRSAKRNLVERFAVVGTTERFDETLVLLGREFGWRRLAYLRRNVSRARVRREELSDDTVSRIRELNRHDVELHAFASRLLRERLEAAGSAFERDLERLRRRNAVYSSWPLATRAWERFRRETRRALAG